MNLLEEYLKIIQLKEDDTQTSYVTLLLIARDTYKTEYQKIKQTCKSYDGADQIECILNSKVPLLYRYQNEVRKISSICKSPQCIERVQNKLDKIQKLIDNSKNQNYQARNTETQ